LALLLLFSEAIPATGNERAALVVGNGSYEHTAPLPNPPRDARAVAAALRRIGFDVLEGIDLTHQQMRGQLQDFGRRAKGAETALFFYAGHALELEGRNHILPIDTELQRSSDLGKQSLDVNDVLRVLDGAAQTGLLFLDACRDNPLGRQLPVVESAARAGRGRSVDRRRSAAIGQGLAPIKAPKGLLIAFATRPGDTAADGTGDHSPFTAAMLAQIEKPGLEIRELMTRVRQDVLRLTDNRQQLWEESSLIENFYFVPSISAPGKPPFIIAPF
jgi:uncharacterized caspase-like protein